MSSRLHTSDELFDSPQYGWEKLKFLLDKNLPVKAKNSFSIMRMGIAASLTGLLLLNSLIIHEDSFRLLSRNSYQEKATQNANENSFKKEHLRMQTVRTSNYQQPVLDHVAEKKINKKAVNETSVMHRLVPEQKTEGLVRIDDADVETKNGFSAETIYSQLMQDSIQPVNCNAGFGWISDKMDGDIQHKRRFQFSVGAAVNINPTQPQSLQPFPAAEILYKASSNLFISLGLTAGSVVATSGKGISKTVYLNDTVNNIQFYNKVTSYTRLYYADIPLMAGVHLSKRWSAEGGLQGSILLNSKNKESIDKYDFQMRLANVPQNTFIGSAVAAPENNYQMSPLRIDYRLVGGLRYSMHKTAFVLTYQYAFKPAFQGQQVTADRNQVLTFKVLYKIR